MRVSISFAAALAALCLFSQPSFGATSSSDTPFSFSTAATTEVYDISGASQHADLNNDGREDFVIPTYGYSVGIHQISTFAVQLSNGDGTYAKPVTYTLPDQNSVLGVYIADVNGDKLPDLLVFGQDTSGYHDTLFLYINNGAGVFTETTSMPLGVSNPSCPSAGVVGDFNHDGIMDFACLDIETHTYLRVWFGDGKSGFTVGPLTRTLTPAFSNTNLMLGDFDGDGRADIAIQYFSNYDQTQILYGDGTGYFPAQRVINVPTGSLFSATDVNGDGKTDIVASAFNQGGAHYLSVFYGDSNRDWSNHTIIPTAHCPTGEVVAADVNGDGINDLIVREGDCSGNSNPGYIGVLTRNSDSSYNPEQTVFTSPSNVIVTMDAIRANLDTKPDITFLQCVPDKSFCQSYITTNLLNTTPGQFHSCEAPNTFEGINVCGPTPGSTVSDQVSFRIGAAGQVPMRKVEVWVDGEKLGEQLNGFSNYTFMDKTFTLFSGKKNVDVYATGWDNSLQKKTFTFTVK